MNKKELTKQFPWLTKGELEYELKNVRKDYKTERGFLAHLAKENKKNEGKFTMPDISTLRIDVEWKKSRYWGWCPRAEWWCSFKDGTSMNGSEHVGKDADKTWYPYFEGGIGTNCYYAIAKFLGGEMEWNEGKTWDRIIFTFK